MEAQRYAADYTMELSPARPRTHDASILGNVWDNLALAANYLSPSEAARDRSGRAGGVRRAGCVWMG